MSTTTARSPIELRKAGNRAFNAALGHDDAQAFLRLCKGSGDFTKERHEQPERTLDEIFTAITRIQKEEADFIAAKNNRRF
jgi:hypothetical protein